MAPKANARTREKGSGIDVPAHPMVPGAKRRPADARTLREMRLHLREQADDAADSGETGEAAELLLELGRSLLSTSNFTAGILVLDEALDAARQSREHALVDQVVQALDGAMIAAAR